MAKSNKSNTSALNGLMRVVAQMLEEAKNGQVVESVNTETPAVLEPIDCDALFDLIQAAQTVFSQNCPIA